MKKNRRNGKKGGKGGKEPKQENGDRNTKEQTYTRGENGKVKNARGGGGGRGSEWLCLVGGGGDTRSFPTLSSVLTLYCNFTFLYS